MRLHTCIHIYKVYTGLLSGYPPGVYPPETVPEIGHQKTASTYASYILVLRLKTRGSQETRVCRIPLSMWVVVKIMVPFGSLKY